MSPLLLTIIRHVQKLKLCCRNAAGANVGPKLDDRHRTLDGLVMVWGFIRAARCKQVTFRFESGSLLDGISSDSESRSKPLRNRKTWYLIRSAVPARRRWPRRSSTTAILGSNLMLSILQLLLSGCTLMTSPRLRKFTCRIWGSRQGHSRRSAVRSDLRQCPRACRREDPAEMPNVVERLRQLPGIKSCEWSGTGKPMKE